MKARTQHFIEKGALTILTLIYMGVGLPWLGLSIHNLLEDSAFGIPVVVLASLTSLVPFFWLGFRWLPREKRLKELMKAEKD